ncbi:hypothetical protein H2O64_20620 [Kordia sp. YSTF-M3]|uniref:Natural product n=1 Tax=Kordia aestuariivivens TaxID=2759037 RepID=A0ABR7QEX0_9FLAO|nr:hypothetical protein [Kordia aestuariivivens]MBC8757089.1 hypothetical protein [Kordia aestuariivivens]
MKKKNFKSLELNKKSISSLKEQEEIKGKGILTYADTCYLCTGLAGSCWCNLTVTGCPTER